MTRLLSLAAGVQLDVAPADMVSVAFAAGWPAVGIWFDGKTWSDSTSREVRRRLDDTGVIALDIEPIIPSEDGNDFAEQLIEAAAVIGAQHILFTSRLKEQVRTTDRYQQVCEMARPHGINVVCEFLPIFPLNTLSMAAKLLPIRGQQTAECSLTICTCHDRAHRLKMCRQCRSNSFPICRFVMQWQNVQPILVAC